MVLSRLAVARSSCATARHASKALARAPTVIRAAAIGGKRQQAGGPGTGTPAALAPPPFPTVIIYNQSKHATQSVLADIRAVWGNKIRVLQTLEEGKQRLPGMDGALYVKPKSWGNMEHFEER
eukprot:CAMPEP_0206483190 /NCGR_PEP_ID=MMETSP0324_2-20121206/39285_1 /ASSEMBLY_ACC=CAM_ASM_000836 /TAXON_ID=2866 /ORGANISM="Crypthecodinium cohnii, Strain Seligo" /LENGTH=122 /DNA_ID=CAMNT_0053961207 /DNA_START=62 /DNA_END=426 /DNA_ORIENTATION=+